MNADPLSNLRDWHLPDPVSWWPPAPGWWLVAGVLLATLLLTAHVWRRWHQQRTSTRIALRQLDALQTALTADGDVRRFAAGVAQLLRRLALVRFPSAQIAGLTGQAWLSFLDATGGNGGFTQGAGRLFTDAAYRADATAQDGDPEQLHKLAADWIRNAQSASSQNEKIHR